MTQNELNTSKEASNSRRFFLRWLTGQGLAIFEEMRGRPQLALNDLPNLSLDESSRLIPAIFPETEIQTGENQVILQTPGDSVEPLSFSIPSLELSIFNLFNGQNTLLKAAQRISAECGVEEHEALLAAHNLFLRLVAHRICAPANSTNV